jgi:ribosomal protein S18 acetylase RimI-like enzyme
VNFKKFASEKMRSRTSLVLVATMNGRAVGYLIASIIKYPPVFKEKKCGFIFDLMVHRDFRRIGVGSKLFSEARNWFIRKKINRIELSVAATNPLATAFWEKMGFKTYMERKYMRLR